MTKTQAASQQPHRLPRTRFSLRKLVKTLERTQVELHGQYSLQRLKELHAHTLAISETKNALVYLLTPLPCLVVVALLDCFWLDPPENGVLASAGFWVRLLGCVCVIAFTELTQLQGTLPALALDDRKILTLSIFTTLTVVPSVLGLALLIGFPVPFTLPMTGPAFFFAFGIGFWYYCGDIFQSSAEVQRDTKGYLLMMICQMTLTLIYPMYAYVFAMLSVHAQTAFVLLLPCIKVVAKNAMSFILADLDDLKPEFVIFNAEIFHALYVSLCMGSSTSVLTTAVLMTVDVVQAWLSLNDMKYLVRDLSALMDKMVATDSLAEILELDSHVARHSSLRVISRNSVYKNQALKASTSLVKVSVETIYSSTTMIKSSRVLNKQVLPTPATSAAANPLKMSATPSFDPGETSSSPQPDQVITTQLGLDARERLEFIQKTAKVLFMTEYATLIEFTEVVTPLIYCANILLMYYLPNRTHYPQLASLSQDELFHNLQSVLLYASLELLSFLAIGSAIKRQLGITRTHQLTFVLTKQWRMTQSKFVLWVVYISQTYLIHFGADFSFQFKWLSISSGSGKRS